MTTVDTNEMALVSLVRLEVAELAADQADVAITIQEFHDTKALLLCAGVVYPDAEQLALANVPDKEMERQDRKLGNKASTPPSSARPNSTDSQTRPTRMNSMS